jgi:hypothetical protein
VVVVVGIIVVVLVVVVISINGITKNGLNEVTCA